MFAARITRAARFAVAAAALASFAVSAGAAEMGMGKDDKVPKSYTSMQKMKPTDVMHMMDADNSGYVTKEEFMKFQESLFDKMDKDHDARLTAPEFTDKG
jgi:EF hand